MTQELDPQIKIRAPMRCEGIGSLDCAEDTGTGRRLAVRWLPMASNGGLAAAALKKLPRHPTFPEIRTTGQVGSTAYVAIDFPEGKTLAALLADHLAPEVLCRIGAHVASALALAHAEGIVHGELSAESLLIVDDGRTIIWDLPLVIANRLTDIKGEQRGASALSRMAPFLSPERAQGADPTAAADVYALGAVLCLAGGGQLPSSESFLEVLHQLATGEWSPRVPGLFSVPVRHLLQRMVSREAWARPSAREVAELLTPMEDASTQPDFLPPLATTEVEAKVMELASAPEAPQDEVVGPDRSTVVASALLGGLVAAALAGVLYFAFQEAPSPGVPVPDPVERTARPTAAVVRRGPSTAPVIAAPVAIEAPLAPAVTLESDALFTLEAAPLRPANAAVRRRHRQRTFASKSLEAIDFVSRSVEAIGPLPVPADRSTVEQSRHSF